MDLETISALSPIIIAVFSALASMVIFMIKKLIERVHALEQKACGTASRKDTRTMIEDKVDPLQRQMEKIDEKLDKIIDIMIAGK